MRGGAVRQILVVIGACVLLLLGLRLATVGGESTASFGLVRLPSPTPSPAEACAAFAQVWMDLSGSGPDTVAAVSRCRRGASGAWVPVPDAPSPRFRDAPLANAITTQLAGLETALPPDLQRQIADVYDPVATPGSGNVRVDARTEEINRQYARQLEVYLRDPAHRELATYVAWLMARKEAAVMTFRDGCATYARMRAICANLAQAVGAGWVPWPWELGDERLLTEYLAQLAEPDEQVPSTRARSSGG